MWRQRPSLASCPPLPRERHQPSQEDALWVRGCGEGATQPVLALSPRPSPPQSSLLRQSNRSWGRGGRKPRANAPDPRLIDNGCRTRQHVSTRSRFARSFSDPTSWMECLAPHGVRDSAFSPPRFVVHSPRSSLVSLGFRVSLGGQFRSFRVPASGRSGRWSGVWKEYAGAGTGPADAGGHSRCGSSRA